MWRQVLGGSLIRGQVIAGAQEYVELFKEHPRVKDAIGKLQGFVGEGGIGELFGGAAGGAGAPSERLRAVQERLRRKMAARDAAKTAPSGK